MKPRTAMLEGAILVGGLLLIVLILGVEQRWHGVFPIEIELRSSSGRPIQAVSYVTLRRKEEADWVLQHPESPEPIFVEVRHEQDHLAATATSSGRSWCGLQREYVADQFIVLKIAYADHSAHRIVESIPEGRGTRHMSTTVP